MKNIILNTDNALFLITFQFKTTNYKFIVGQDVAFMNVLKENPRTGIETIKIFNQQKNKFERVSKENILMRFKWDTEIYLYLKNHYYFN